MQTISSLSKYQFKFTCHRTLVGSFSFVYSSFDEKYCEVETKYLMSHATEQNKKCFRIVSPQTGINILKCQPSNTNNVFFYTTDSVAGTVRPIYK